MTKRRIGVSDLEAPAIGLGCMSLSGIYGASDDAQGLKVLDAAIEAGIALLDTSDAYGAGHNEELLARAIVRRRDRIVLATKFGNLIGGRDGKFADGRPETVVRSCEASLRRLKVDVIDLYYQHRIDPDVPVEETVGAMSRLVEQGKVRALGLSEASPQTIRRAHATHAIAAVQNEFSLLYRSEAEETRQTTSALGISLIAYSPLGRGLLTATVDAGTAIPEGDGRLRHPRFAADNIAHNAGLVRRLETMAKDKGCTIGQLALAWLLAQGDDVFAIPGTKHVARLHENVGALAVRLTVEETAEIARSIPKDAAQGLRYPAGQMKSVFV